MGLARQLAAADRPVARAGVRINLDAQLQASWREIQAAQRTFSAEAQARRQLPPSAEWLLDNFHVVQEQLREIEQDLSGGYYAELPKLADGKYAGYPRVYGLARELIRHTDGRFDNALLARYIAAYQESSPLTLGELWAVPIMLRVGLVETLARLLELSLARLEARRRADGWAARLLEAAGQSPEELEAALRRLAADVTPSSESVFWPEFAVQLMQGLRDQPPALAPALRWLETQLTRSNATLEDYLRELNSRRAINRVSVGNVITGMRLLSTADWPAFVEELSEVERVLARDPAGQYSRMDFATRDRYRHVVETLARRTHSSETEVARQAIALSANGARDTRGQADQRRAHVGYFLIDRGRRELQAVLGGSALALAWTNWIADHPAVLYFGTVLLLVAAIVGAGVTYTHGFDPGPAALLVTALALLFPALSYAINLVNWAVTGRVPPRPPPKLDYRRGIPVADSTMVVIPALLSSTQGVSQLLDHLEQRHLTNRDPQVFFALLTDFADAPTRECPDDAALLEAARAGIIALNEKYAVDRAEVTPGPDRFFLFHRERRWNPTAQVWMGWERKRGKLIELTRLLRGATDTSYVTIAGNRDGLPAIRYVITLDADTELPPNTARRLVGAMAHPLNRPVLDAQRRRVIHGFGILQPRTDVTAAAAARSRFSRITAGATGLDPYSSAVSDVYQDLFQSGTYVGKAIYDLDAVHAVLDQTFPENLLLSHDLLEGGYARAGLASDVVLLEDIPSGYDAYARRLHRWTRGDWQIVDWLGPWVRNEAGERVPNPLPWLERWKILDNLRRSLTTPALVLSLLAGWLILPGEPAVWTLLFLGAILFPLLRQMLGAFAGRPAGEPWRYYWLAVGHEIGRAVEQALLQLAVELSQAIDIVDAIARALTRRRWNPGLLLEWTSAAVAEHRQAQTAGEYLRRMWPSPVLAILALLAIALVRPSALAPAVPVLALWLAAPWIAAWVSQPLTTGRLELTDDARAQLRQLAAKMWAFYDRFAGEQDHWLPPDNYQTDPRPVVAHRTSPTNIGFLLLSIVAAYDFQFFSEGELAVRLARVIGTLQEMEREHGHWYNWYDTLTLQPLMPRYLSTVDSGNLAAALIVVKQAGLERADASGPDQADWAGLAARTQALLDEMDFRFLYSDERELFTIGYNLETGQLDRNYYDLLASEARLASYIAIAWGQVPGRHWFRLGRPLVRMQGRVALLSWGGTMFEYLMPTLFMPDYPLTLLAESYRAAVARQIDYGRERRVPWGISESGFYGFDFQYNYQYRMFGVPDMSLKRETGENLVVAPYATFLALPFAPERALANLQDLRRAGAVNEYGFYEALDYTPSRQPNGQSVSIVREFMAHHQGMSLCALDNVVNGDAIRRRFRREAAMAAVELLLQERVPEHTPLVKLPPDPRPLPRRGFLTAATHWRQYSTPHTPVPRAQLLSNGNYTVMVSNAGGGYSAWHDLRVTRWREDTTCDDWGSFVYVRDVTNGNVWSVTYQPTQVEPDEYHVTYVPEGVEFWRRDGSIETRTEITVSPQENVEIRQVTLTNHGTDERTLELTSYAEVVLAPARADAAHPAFQKLFVESEYIPEQQLLLFRRRPRGPGETPLWALHRLSALDGPLAGVRAETDRARFIGRGGTLSRPRALDGPLSNTTGAVLDPVMSLRGQLRLKPGETRQVAFITGVTSSRERALELADAFDTPRELGRARDLAHVHSRIVLQHLNMHVSDGQLFQRLASRVLYPESAFQAPASVAARNTAGQSTLWSLGISGDFPIVLLHIGESGELDLVRQLLLAHEYWRMHNLTVDLVILDKEPTSYNSALGEAIHNILSTSLSHPHLDKPGGVFIRRAEHMTPEARVLLETIARVNLKGELGGLEEQLHLTGPRAVQMASLENEHERDQPPDSRGRPVDERTARAWTAPARFSPDRWAKAWTGNSHRPRARTVRRALNQVARVAGRPRGWQSRRGPAAPLTDRPGARLQTGLGGFSADGREYVIELQAGDWTPLPWSNVLANPGAGAVLTEAGLGYCWAGNSQQNKLTPWSNDPVRDRAGQVLYLRDEATGELWTPTPLPCREREPYTIRHGAGYSQFEHTSHGLALTLRVFTPREDPLILMRLTLQNDTGNRRRIAVVAYNEWVLGATPEEARPFLVTELEPDTRAILARNTYNVDFQPGVAFAALTPRPLSVTADRTEFLGRQGTLANPEALADGEPFSGAVGARLDPCAALQTSLELAPGETRELVWMIGQGKDAADARRLIWHYCDPANVKAASEDTEAFWDELLDTVQVKTPDPSFDVLVNRWLVYQALACRVWGRSAFYQSGGAYGFRDQLQDVMALVWAAPQLAREHILRAASRQFLEGDVQHWWHPPLGKGVRTRISDDPLWLVFVADHYMTATGDRAVLDEPVTFLKAPPLSPGENEAYGEPAIDPSPAPLYEHLVRALDHGLAFGAHGLPLMGTGDWNDGMNAVGAGGKGESVWLGWFLYTNLMRLAPVCEARDDPARAKHYRETAAQLAEALEAQGWDGNWYRRAFFDDGQPLGSAQNAECQIDAIAQAWAVLSGAAPPERARAALEAVAGRLVNVQDRLLLLLSPPFDHSDPSPGYIQGYVPGIRENGGQYTHGALWAVWAQVALGDGDRAYEWFRLLNPVEHARTPEEVARYQVEPYVVAADVYAHPMHCGRGGWTWYTGSAAWMYRLAVQAILGLQLRGEAFTVAPCVPRAWPGFEIRYRDGGTTYTITVENQQAVNRADHGPAPADLKCGVVQVYLDDRLCEDKQVARTHDDGTHRVRVVLGPLE